MASSAHTTPSQRKPAPPRKNPKDQSAAKSPSRKTPTNFLSLPREIRQEILYLTWECRLRYNSLSTYSRFWNPEQLADRRNRQVLNWEKLWINRWYTKLGRIDSRLGDDIQYVRGRHLDHVKIVEKECRTSLVNLDFFFESQEEMS
ncbi:hypothetical protein EG328_008882 [Venturia inaequalis]|uniref:Uncharacterized protein n=1 Tax=Venturia inaequalis TaxID=5025 RepID=A0A8H3U9X8_VENIN|nr:hypothetical protein EG328_008882 [Venturia inaequalis]